MKEKSILQFVKESLFGFCKVPALPFLGVLLFLLFWSYSKFGSAVARFFQSTTSNTLWIVASVVFLLICGGVFSTFLIVISKDRITKTKTSLSVALRKFWLKNSLTLFIFLIFFNLVNLTLFIFTRIMIFASSWFTVQPETFRLLSILISFFWVAAIIIFFSFTSFFIILEDLSFLEGIKSSLRFVKKEYISTLSITVVFYALISFIKFFDSIYADLINYIIVLPLMFFVLTKFVLDFKNGL